MPRYAAGTVVSAERSKAEIEETLRRYGAEEFQTGWTKDRAMIAFKANGLFVRFVLPMPDPQEKRFRVKKDRWGLEKRLSEEQSRKLLDQEVRQRWRALLLVVKAKLEAVECRISTFEQEFLAFIVLPNQMSVMDWLEEQALTMIREGEMPRLALPAPPGPKIVQADEERLAQ